MSALDPVFLFDALRRRFLGFAFYYWTGALYTTCFSGRNQGVIFTG